MKIKPNAPYILIKKYVKSVVPGKFILSNEEQYHNWGIVEAWSEKDPNKWEKNQIVYVKPYSKITIDGYPDFFLVKYEDVIATIEE